MPKFIRSQTGEFPTSRATNFLKNLPKDSSAMVKDGEVRVLQLRFSENSSIYVFEHHFLDLIKFGWHSFLIFPII